MYNYIDWDDLAAKTVSVEEILELWCCTIAGMMNVSRSTLYRKINEAGIAWSLRDTEVSDQELDCIILDINPFVPKLFRHFSKKVSRVD